MATKKVPPHVQRLTELTRDDPQLQALVSDPSIAEALEDPALTLDQMFAIPLDGYAERPLFGQRAYEVRLDPASGRHVRELLPRFDTATYGEVHQKIKNVASAWQHDEDHGVKAGDFVCLLGFNGAEFAIVELACWYAHAVSVPLLSSMGRVALEDVFSNTSPVAVAATITDLVLAAELAGSHPSVRSIIVMDEDERVDDDLDQIAAARAELVKNGSKARLTTLDQLVAAGADHTWTPLPPSDESGDRLVQLMHSSGTTGTPKGAMLDERYMKAYLNRQVPGVPVVVLSFAPMGHSAGRGRVYSTLLRGGSVYFVAKPDMSTVFDDLRLVRPTEGFFFPRVLETVYQHYRREVGRRANDGLDVEAAEAEVKAEMRDSFLGDRLCLISMGGAPCKPEVRKFVEDCFPARIVDGYGSTEVGSVAGNGVINRGNVIDYRLRDLPELGYFTTDKPYPRGELCVKTRTMISGYFNNPEATAELYDEDGYLCLGDVVEERGPDRIHYIGRRNDVTKLAQGEFVTLSALDEAFENGSDLIDQIYVYGTPLRSYVVAVVVPDVEQPRLRLGHDPDEAELRTLALQEIKRVGSEAGLRSFEVPRDVIIELEPFSVENGLLTGLRKRKRPSLQQKYGERLEALYDEIERKQDADLSALRDPASPLTLLEKVGKALEASLGIDEVDVTQPSNFIELGGDSLGAVGFAALLTEIFGVEVPLNAIVSPAGNPARWAATIEAALRHESDGAPTFASVHGAGARELHAADLTLEAFIDEKTLGDAPTASPVDDPRTVLVTGATGFLGRFLALEWLERLAPSDGKVICIVRASDEGAARRRLADSLSSGDPQLEARFQALADDHLEVVVGDVAEPKLGLGPTEFERLAGEVDHVVHSAALVNHMLDYEHLFSPNVAGTAEVIRLALTTRQKRIDFVSSAAALAYVDASNGLDEDAPLLSDVVIGDRYGASYGASKWAGETLLHRAHQRFGLPVSIFRGNMMLPHRQYHGQINAEDIFTRLLYSVIVTGLAPKSFYELGPDGTRQKAHYEGLPVDFIAASIVAIGARLHHDLQTFHIAHGQADEGSSLDDFVDWIEAAGYHVERVEDRQQWLERFEAALRALPEEQQRLSSLAVIDNLRNPQGARNGVGSKRYHDALAATSLGAGTPQLTRDFIEKCLDDMRRLGLIADAGRGAPAT